MTIDDRIATAIATRPLAPAEEERRLLLQDTLDFFSRRKQGNVHKWLFSVPAGSADNVNGSACWSALYQAPKYYLPHYETEVINRFSASVDQLPLIRGILKATKTVYDLGPGSEECVYKKTQPVLNHIKKGATYCAVDVSSEFVDGALKGVRNIRPDLALKACLEDFENPTPYLSKDALIIFFGSTMFNVPCSLQEGLPANELIKQLVALKNFTRDGYMLVTQDITNERQALFDAYDSPEHAAMTTNFAWRIQRDLAPKGNFDPTAWGYEPVWREENHQFAHGFKALENQNFIIGGTVINVRKGEFFITHNSFKLPRHVFSDIAYEAGYRTLQTFQNERFVLHMMRVKPFLK